jgi:hypothetical protein
LIYFWMESNNSSARRMQWEEKETLWFPSSVLVRNSKILNVFLNTLDRIKSKNLFKSLPADSPFWMLPHL